LRTALEYRLDLQGLSPLLALALATSLIIRE